MRTEKNVKMEKKEAEESLKVTAAIQPNKKHEINIPGGGDVQPWYIINVFLSANDIYGFDGYEFCSSGSKIETAKMCAFYLIVSRLADVA